jgi:hypothetical protein
MEPVAADVDTRTSTIVDLTSRHTFQHLDLSVLNQTLLI